jgi:hypothetical protein
MSTCGEGWIKEPGSGSMMARARSHRRRQISKLTEMGQIKAKRGLASLAASQGYTRVNMHAARLM